MKNITIYITTYGIPGADTDSKYFFSEIHAMMAASDKAAHLTEQERKNYTIYTEGYSVRLPDEYSVTTAKQLVLDLFNGDVESTDFDICTGQFVTNQIFYQETL